MRRPARGQSVSLVNDNAIALDERIYHLLSTTFAAQTPKSRTLHFITNVVVEPGSDDPLTVHSNQLIMELRTGDYRQVGLACCARWPPRWTTCSCATAMISRSSRRSSG